MAKFRKKVVVDLIEAITFDELVAHGRTQTEDTNGMPWSFEYEGHVITHETDDCYIIPTPPGAVYRFERGDMLITSVFGIWPCKGDIFAATYEPEPDGKSYDHICATTLDAKMPTVPPGLVVDMPVDSCAFCQAGICVQDLADGVVRHQRRE